MRSHNSVEILVIGAGIAGGDLSDYPSQLSLARYSDKELMAELPTRRPRDYFRVMMQSHGSLWHSVWSLSAKGVNGSVKADHRILTRRNRD